MAGSVTAENPSVMPAVTVGMEATAPTANCCKSQETFPAVERGKAAREGDGSHCSVGPSG
jgi:hypothetical protein